jgi:hypothetical protein
LISDWIRADLPDFKTYPDWASAYFGQNVPDPNQDADGDGISNYAEYLLNSDPLHPDLLNAPTVTIDGDNVKLTFQHPANLGVFFESTDQFPTNSWSPVSDPQNKLLFPMQTMTRTISDVFSSERRFYRVRIVEP